MNRSFPALLFTIILFASIAIHSQTAINYSESTPYVPGVLNGKSDSDKKKDIGAKPAPVIPAATTITIPVSVLTNETTPVAGLQASDFKAFVDDAEAEIVSVETKGDPLAIVLVLDMSPSSHENIRAMKAVAQRMVDKLRPEDKVMVVGFSADIQTATELTSDRKLIARGLERLDLGDGTSLYRTIAELFEKKLNMISGPSSIILITDGVDTTSGNMSYEKSLFAAEKGNAPVFPIYVDTYSPNVDPNVIRSRSGPINLPPGILIPSGRTSFPASGLTKEMYDLGRVYLTDLLKLSGGRPVMAKEIYGGKTDAFDSIPAELLSRYHITFKLPPPREPGERRATKIRVNKPNVKILAKGSYIEK